MTGEWTSYRRLRAPQADGARLIEPPLDEIDRALATNRAALAGHYDVQGRALANLRAQARRDLLAAAGEYVGEYADFSIDHVAADAPLILTGHQPQLFHPGVWLKNFLADHIAREHGGVAIHVVIDADLFATPSIRAACGTIQSPQWQAIEFDAPAERIPNEERTLADPARFASFGERVAAAIAPFVPDPLISSFWPQVVERSKSTTNVGACLAQTRHLVEHKWGLTTLEIPQSTACNFDAFGWLTAHLLAQAPRLWQVHNEALAGYRAAHRIRTTAQPVPNLERDGEWLETPFWTWNTTDPARRALWVRTHGKTTVISDRTSREYQLTLDEGADGQAAVEQLRSLAASQIKIRPRALVNTLYCRLLLSDLFIHGIGGAKYDQITDAIMATFFGIEPPAYAVATGTLRLPIKRPTVTASDEQQLARDLRRMTYHPEVFIDATVAQQPDVAKWIEQKRHWVETEQTQANARERYLAIREANARLRPALQHGRATLLRQQTEVAALLRADALLGSREWSFCLHAENSLRDFLQFDA